MTDQVRNNDVLCGRGGATNNHVGNKRFRQLVEQHKPEYLRAVKRDKSQIARRIVRIVRENGGRFLKRDERVGMWVDVGDKKAREKTSQALREGLDVRNKVPRGDDSSDDEHRPSKRRKKAPTTQPTDIYPSPSIVSETGEIEQLPDLEEEILTNVMPQFIFHTPPVTTNDCDEVASV